MSVNKHMLKGMINYIQIQEMVNNNRCFYPLERQIHALLLQKNRSRAELVELLNKPRTTIYDYLIRLINKDIVTKYSVEHGGRGRPTIYYAIKNEYLLYKWKDWKKKSE